MKRLSELQYFSRMGAGNNLTEPAGIPAGDFVDNISNDEDIFGAYAEPADIAGDMDGYEDNFLAPPGESYNGYEDDYFEEPADLTAGDYGMYESRNIIVTEANPFRRRFETKSEQKLIDLEAELDKWESVANKSDKEAVTKRKDLKKQIAQLKKKIGFKEMIYDNSRSIKESAQWLVRIPANVYDGRYFDYRYVTVVAPGATAAEAVEYVKSHSEEYLAKIDGMRSGKKRMVKSPVEKNVWFDKAFAGQRYSEGAIAPRDLLDESIKRVSESSDVTEMVQAYLSDEDPMILDSIIVQTVEDATQDARNKYSYDMSDAEIDNIADFVEFTVTVGKKRGASASEIAAKLSTYIAEEVSDSLEEAVAWRAGRLTEITGASYARDYLAQVDDPTDVTYEDYIAWLEDQGVPEQKISKIWFNTNKKKHIAKLTDVPKSKEPKSSFGKAIAKRGGDEKVQQSQPTPPKPTSEPIAKPESSANVFTSADQKAVEEIIRRAGYKLETLWGEDHPVSLRQSKTRDNIPFSILDAYIETGDRGPRTDHGGGRDGDDWMDSEQINRAFAPYKDKWAPRAKALEEKLRAEGYPTAEVTVDYGEKGHIGLTVFISSSTPRRKTESAQTKPEDFLKNPSDMSACMHNIKHGGDGDKFLKDPHDKEVFMRAMQSRKTESTGARLGSMGSPARGDAKEPIRRNASGREKHPDELDYEDNEDFFDDDDLYDDGITLAVGDEYDDDDDIDDDDDMYDDIDDDDDDMYDDIDDDDDDMYDDIDDDQWMPESGKRKLTIKDVPNYVKGYKTAKAAIAGLKAYNGGDDPALQDAIFDHFKKLKEAFEDTKRYHLDDALASACDDADEFLSKGWGADEVIEYLEETYPTLDPGEIGEIISQVMEELESYNS